MASIVCNGTRPDKHAAVESERYREEERGIERREFADGHRSCRRCLVDEIIDEVKRQKSGGTYIVIIQRKRG